jgi:hypothetical protein
MDKPWNLSCEGAGPMHNPHQCPFILVSGTFDRYRSYRYLQLADVSVMIRVLISNYNRRFQWTVNGFERLILIASILSCGFYNDRHPHQEKVSADNGGSCPPLSGKT